MSTWHDEPAAVSRVRLYSVRSGKLPDARIRDAAPVAGRRRSFTLRFEDPAVMYDLGVGQDTPASARLEFDRLAAYMKFTGADTLMYPAVWYKGNINDNYMPRTHVPHYLKEICARFERDGLSFVPTVNQQWFIDFRDPKDVKSLYDGSLHATPITILDTGLPNMGGWHYSPTYYNISHPAVQRRLLEEFDQILDECAEFKSFKGVSIDLFNQINVMWWGSDRAGYNDYSIDMFRKAKNVDVPKFTGAFRGRDYAKWLRANAWEAWLDWRCDVVADLYARFAARLAARRPDLTLFVAAYSRQRGRDGVAFRDDIDDPALVRKMLRECGIDGDRLARIPNLSLGIQSTSAFARDELRRDGTIPEDRKAKTRDLPETPGFYAEARKTAYPFALFSDSYYETAIGAPADANGKYRGDGRLYGDWLKKEFTWRVSHINAAGREALRPFAKALKDGDMLCFAKGAFLISLNGMEDVLVPWMREFRKIGDVQRRERQLAGSGEAPHRRSRWPPPRLRRQHQLRAGGGRPRPLRQTPPRLLRTPLPALGQCGRAGARPSRLLLRRQLEGTQDDDLGAVLEGVAGTAMLDAVEHRLADRAVETAKRIGGVVLVPRDHQFLRMSVSERIAHEQHRHVDGREGLLPAGVRPVGHERHHVARLEDRPHAGHLAPKAFLPRVLAAVVLEGQDSRRRRLDEVRDRRGACSRSCRGTRR